MWLVGPEAKPAGSCQVLHVINRNINLKCNTVTLSAMTKALCLCLPTTEALPCMLSHLQEIRWAKEKREQTGSEWDHGAWLKRMTTARRKGPCYSGRIWRVQIYLDAFAHSREVLCKQWTKVRKTWHKQSHFGQQQQQPSLKDKHWWQWECSEENRE